MRKTFGILAAASAVFLTSCLTGSEDRSGQRSESAPVTVKVLKVSSSEAGGQFSYVGRVEPSKSAVILNQYPGTAVELNVREGSRISKGAVIARISSESLQSAYDIADAALKQAEDAYSRASKVYDNGSVTEVKMVEIRTRLEQARAAQRSAAQALDDLNVRAPFSGVAGEVYCHEGERLAAAAPVVQLVDVESVEVHFSVPESEYADIPLGTRAEVEVPALRKTLEASVAVKGVSASVLSHSYDFVLKNLSDSYSLMPGMVCKVKVGMETNGGIAVPASAVMTDMKGRYVWEVDETDSVCKTYITTGGYAGKAVTVSEGLEDGDLVIVEGSRKVSSGMKVKVEE